MSERIAKHIAHRGLCSRREAERWIEQGEVTVNGKKITSPALNVTAEDTIFVNGKKLPPLDKPRLWLFHKPTNSVVTNKDPEGRTTIFELLPKKLPRVITIGRLDLNTEGLLLLTNNGDLARKLELPATGWIRRYRVRAYGSCDEKRLNKIRGSVTIDSMTYKVQDIQMDAAKTGHNHWYQVAIAEGKNREVRKLFDYIGLSVNRLIRISYGPFQLGTLRVGECKEVSEKILKEQITL